MELNRKLLITANLSDSEKGKLLDLSEDVFSQGDIQWFIAEISNASFLETIKMPALTNENAISIISALELATRNQSTLLTVIMDSSGLDVEVKIVTELLLLKIKNRLSRNNKKIFAIHGGGNIGIGLMGDVISKSSYEYDIVATSNNKLLRDIVNISRNAWVKHDTTDDEGLTCIRNLMMIPRERNDLIWLYKNASIAAICLTPVAFEESSIHIATALIERYHDDGSGLKILILMNKPDCDVLVMNKLYDNILSLTSNEALTKSILAVNKISPTVIDRIVTSISDEEILADMTKRLTRSGFKNLPVGEMVKLIAQLNLKVALFNAERHFSFYVANDIPEAYRLSAVKVTKNLKRVEAIKNKFINGPHAVLAWIGALKGHTNIADSINDNDIYDFIDKMMRDEIAPILLTEYPDTTRDELDSLKDLFITRCRNSNADTVIRVGRDPLRKLDSGGRIRGTIELKKKNNISTDTKRLELGIALGVLYALSDLDPENPGCRQMKKIYSESNYSYDAVLSYCGVAPSGYFHGLDVIEDAKLMKRISVIIAQIALSLNSKKMGTNFVNDHCVVDKLLKSSIRVSAMPEGLFFNTTYHAKKHSQVNIESKQLVRQSSVRLK